MKGQMGEWWDKYKQYACHLGSVYGVDEPVRGALQWVLCEHVLDRLLHCFELRGSEADHVVPPHVHQLTRQFAELA